MHRCISRDNSDPAIVDKGSKRQDSPTILPITHGSDVLFNQEGCARNKLVHMEGSLLMALHSDLGEYAMKKVVTVLLKSGTNGGDLLFTDSNFLDGKDVALSGCSLPHMCKECIGIPSSKSDGAPILNMSQGVFPRLCL